MIDYASLDESLAEREAAQLYRRRKLINSPQGVEINLQGKTALNFCSNDYLGLANHPELIEAFTSAAKEYGVGSGAAHLISGHSQHHHQLEEELAEFTGRPRALIFSTGYMANLGVISALFGQGDAVFEDRLNHASLLDAGLLSRARLQRYQHNDVSDLENKLSSSKSENKLIVTDGVFSMDGDVAPLTGLATLAQQHNAWLMVDDAHGLGVLGNNGAGSLERNDLTLDDVPILMGTFGKAFGTFGAFVAGHESLIETLIQSARSYIYTTALPPAVAAATRVALRLVQQESWRRDQLNHLIKQFRQGAEQLGLSLMSSASPIQPLLIGDTAKTVNISQQLLDDGILISAIRPPTVPDGTARLRITLSAEHQQHHVERLLDSLQKVLKP
ncbi:MAG: 8-amino-7-oxononanoate synthase [Gammaproteobacteria bacterium]|nr:8-amino-7-oxononanoate synthase [Gammaproteobacteria bacterium]